MKLHRWTGEAPEGWRRRRIAEAWILAGRPGLTGKIGCAALESLAVTSGGRRKARRSPAASAAMVAKDNDH